MPFIPPAKYGLHSPPRLTFELGAALAVVLLLRLWRLPEAGLPDYDSVRNWQVILELARGDFAHLFHHGSPGFLLLYVPIAWLTTDFQVFQLLNALLGVAGLGLFAGWVSRTARLSGLETMGLVLLGGTSLLLTFSGRDFTMSSGSLVLAAGLLRSYFRRLHRPHPAALYKVAFWLAAGLCFNYKFLFTLPILAVLEAWQKDAAIWRRGTWWKVLLILASPYLLLGLAGVAAGLPWYRWLGFYVRTVVPPAANIAGRQHTLRLDLLYYPCYLLEFESPPLLAGLGAALWVVLRQEKPRPGQPLSLLAYLLVWAACLLAGMSLLIKAPRGLLFAYLPLAALVVLAGRRLLPGGVLFALLAGAVALNGYRIRQELYARLPTHYPEVALWLSRQGATRIASTVSLGLAPYLKADQSLTVVANERQLDTLRRLGYQYVLLDGYWRVAGVARFDSLRRQTPVAAWPEPQLTAPLLFLEHSEYTGLGYNETRAAQPEAARDPVQLRLYRL
jgi:hypothetical protein